MGRDPNEKTKKANKDLVELMTPIVKALLTDYGVEITYDMLQIYGGHGYIKEYGMEQFSRDVRIAPIWEGTNGIQALDLIGRKMSLDNGLLIDKFINEIESYLNFIKDKIEMDEFKALYSIAFDDFVNSYHHITRPWLSPIRNVFLHNQHHAASNIIRMYKISNSCAIAPNSKWSVLPHCSTNK